MGAVRMRADTNITITHTTTSVNVLKTKAETNRQTIISCQNMSIMHNNDSMIALIRAKNNVRKRPPTNYSWVLRTGFKGTNSCIRFLSAVFFWCNIQCETCEPETSLIRVS